MRELASSSSDVCQSADPSVGSEHMWPGHLYRHHAGQSSSSIFIESGNHLIKVSLVNCTSHGGGRA